MKRRLLLGLVLFSVVNYAQNDIGQNLLVHYPFNGNTEDVSGNGFDATGNATLTSDRFGNKDSAYHFNGVDQFIDLPNNDLLKPELPITFSFWVNFEDLEVTKTFVFTSDYAQDTITGINLSMTAASNNIAMSYGDGGRPSPFSRRTIIGTTSIDTNIWYFVVGIFRGPTDMSIYLSEYNSDSLICLEEDGTYSGSGSSIQYSSNPGSIGRTDANSNKDPYYFNGKIDDFRMWDKALSVAEVEELCQSQNTLSLENHKATEFSIFHDRDNDVIIFDALSKFYNVVIYNSIGQTVFNNEKVNKSIYIGAYRPGLYFLKAKNEYGQIKTFKFIK